MTERSAFQRCSRCCAEAPCGTLGYYVTDAAMADRKRAWDAERSAETQDYVRGWNDGEANAEELRSALASVLYALREITDAGFERRIPGFAVTQTLYAWSSGSGLFPEEVREAVLLFDALAFADTLLASERSRD